MQKTDDITNCPRGVAAELAAIAIDHDVIDTIGRATSWRWREGVISRMPKAATIARILSKSFKSDDPKVWHEKVGENLKPFVAQTFGIDTNRVFESGETINDIYDSLVAILIISNKATREELIYNLCFFKYASSLDEDDEVYELPAAESILGAYKIWATIKLEKILLKNRYVLKDGYYEYVTNGCDSIQISSEKHARNILKINSLRSRIVGYNSYFDLWRASHFELTDEQHVQIEKKIINFSKELDSFIKDEFVLDDVKIKNAKKRLYSFSAISLATEGEVLRWES